jgi:hypothetical protein
VLFVSACVHASREMGYPKHCSTARTQYLEAITAHLSKSSLSSPGSFVVGKRFRYAESVLY